MISFMEIITSIAGEYTLLIFLLSMSAIVATKTNSFIAGLVSFLVLTLLTIMLAPNFIDPLTQKIYYLAIVLSVIGLIMLAYYKNKW